MTDLRVGKPWRHFFRRGAACDRNVPLLRVLIGHQGHGADLAGAVARLATILQDRENVFIERGAGRAARKCKRKREQQKTTARRAQF